MRYDEVQQLCRSLPAAVAKRLLSGSIGNYDRLLPATIVPPADTCLLALSEWLFVVPKLTESQVQLVLLKLPNFVKPKLTTLWEQPETIGQEELLLGLFDNRWITWSPKPELLDVETGERWEFSVPPPHLWSLVLNVPALVLRVRNEYDRRLRDGAGTTSA